MKMLHAGNPIHSSRAKPNRRSTPTFQLAILPFLSIRKTAWSSTCSTTPSMGSANSGRPGSVANVSMEVLGKLRSHADGASGHPPAAPGREKGCR